MPVRSEALERLVAAASGLPGEKLAVPLSDPLAAPVAVGAAAEGDDLPALRRRTGALLVALGEKLEPALRVALERAARAWDQVDAIAVLDAALVAEIGTLRDAWRRFAAAETMDAEDGVRAARAAAATEALLTMDAALGLVGLLERRLATLLRLRLRSENPDLLPAGRPFLDVAAALADAARGWA